MSITVQTQPRTLALRLQQPAFIALRSAARRVAALLTSGRSQAYLLRRLAVFANHDTLVLK